MHTNTDYMEHVCLGQTMGELMGLLQRRKELEARFRRAHGEERRTLGRKLSHVLRFIQACFR